MHVIGFLGKKGVGKNFVADLVKGVLESEGELAAQCAFADPIKEYLEKTLGIDHNLLYGNDLDKEKLTQYLWEDVASPIRAKFGEPTGHVTVRQAMQLFGTELNREMWGKNIWVNVLERKIKEWTILTGEKYGQKPAWCLVTDVRFPNEAELIRKLGKLWLVSGFQRVKHGEKKDLHLSEKHIDSIQGYDYVIRNDQEATRESLLEQVRIGLKTFRS